MSVIPRIIHQIWVGAPMPAHLEADRATWVQHHPRWEIWLWDEASLGWLQNQELFDRADEITASVGQFRADVARYELLRLHDVVGIVCDMVAAGLDSPPEDVGIQSETIGPYSFSTGTQYPGGIRLTQSMKDSLMPYMQPAGTASIS